MFPIAHKNCVNSVEYIKDTAPSQETIPLDHRLDTLCLAWNNWVFEGTRFPISKHICLTGACIVIELVPGNFIVWILSQVEWHHMSLYLDGVRACAVPKFFIFEFFYISSYFPSPVLRLRNLLLCRYHSFQISWLLLWFLCCSLHFLGQVQTWFV